MNSWIKKNRIKVLLLSGIMLGGGAFFYYKSTHGVSAQNRYILASPTRGLLITSLTGTGQVSSQNQIDVHSKVSGAVITIPVKEAQVVKKDDVILVIDSREAQKTIRDAQQNVSAANASLQAARLSLAKLQQPPQTSQVVQAENALNQAKRDLMTLEEPPNTFDVQQAQAQIVAAEQNNKLSSDGKTPQVIRNVYDTTVTTLRSTLQTLQSTLIDADNILGVDNKTVNTEYVKLLSAQDSGQLMVAKQEYGLTKDAFQTTKTNIDALALQNEDTTAIDMSIASTQEALGHAAVMLTTVSKALLASLTSSSFTQSDLDKLKSTIQSDQTAITTKSASILSQLQAITQAKNTYASAQTSLQQAQLSLQKLQQPADQKDIASAKEKIKEKELALSDLKTGPTATDIALQQNTIAQRAADLFAARNKATDAMTNLADYTIRSPFDGILAKLSVQKSDNISSGTTVATLTTHQKIAVVALNEVDAAKVQAGQKATLTFDAVDGLSIAGEVQEVSPLGTVAQGVVNYDVKIGFDTQDERIKSGMSVRASIILSTKPDVLMVPNAAVKSQGNQTYIEVLDASSTAPSSLGGVTSKTAPHQQTVEIGDANDANTEIKNGLADNDLFVVQTIAPSATKTTAAPNTGLRIPGLGGTGASGGAGFRGGTAGGRLGG